MVSHKIRRAFCIERHALTLDLPICPFAYGSEGALPSHPNFVRNKLKDKFLTLLKVDSDGKFVDEFVSENPSRLGNFFAVSAQALSHFPQLVGYA
ncbi:MAG: hypothetical protein NZ805_09350 [Armatimonadetes bacterium]|nr:hypothetical protein [Armatimonadota bacterium]